MSTSEDINTLYRRFGGDASDYQEIIEADQVADVQKSWPLLGHLNAMPDCAEEPVAEQPYMRGGNNEPGFVDQPIATVIQVHSSADDWNAPATAREDSIPSMQSVAHGMQEDHAEDRGELKTVAGLFSKYSKSSSVSTDALGVASADSEPENELKHLFARLSGVEAYDTARGSSERSAKW